MSVTPKGECEYLMNAVLPFAEKMLTEFGEFVPYGGYLTFEGKVVDVGAAQEGIDHAKSKVLFSILQDGMSQAALSGDCKATAIVCNVTVPVGPDNTKSDAIQVFLDHKLGYSAEVFLPYKLIRSQLVFGQTEAQEGQYRIFGKVVGNRR